VEEARDTQDQSDSSRFSRREDKDSEMATEGHRYARKKKTELMSKAEIDEELIDIRVEIEKIALWMQQNTRSRWLYEWPMKTKEKWLVKELMARR